MVDLEIIKDFLRSKSSYLSCGNQRIKDALRSKYNGASFDISEIKLAKKEVKKEYKNLSTPLVIKEAKIDVTPELLYKFNELAKQMGMKGIQSPISSVDPLTEVLKRKSL